MLLGFATLAAGTVRLQLVRHDEFRQLAEQNRVRLEVIRAPRGRVFDRHGRLLADNTPAFAIVYRPPDGDVRAADSLANGPVAILESVLGLGRAELQAIARRATRTGTTTPFREDVDPVVVSRIEELRGDLPHVEVLVTPRRQYPLGGAAAHLLGYAGEINESELETRKDKGYSLGDLIGRSGLERSYETDLRGVDGHQYVVVNALGRRVGTLADVPPVPPRRGRRWPSTRARAASWPWSAGRRSTPMSSRAGCRGRAGSSSWRIAPTRCSTAPFSRPIRRPRPTR